MNTLFKVTLLPLMAFSLIIPFSSCEKDTETTDQTDMLTGQYRLKEVLINNDTPSLLGTISPYYNNLGQVEEIINSWNNQQAKFTYNAAGKLSLYELVDAGEPENDQNLSFSWDGNNATVVPGSTQMSIMKYTVDQDGTSPKIELYQKLNDQEVLFGYMTLTWEDGNLINTETYLSVDLAGSVPLQNLMLLKITSSGTSSTLLLKGESQMIKVRETVYKYDNKINPLRLNPIALLENPVWLSKNNAIIETQKQFPDFSESEAFVTRNKYTYNQEGYPVTLTVTYTENGQTVESSNTGNFIYASEKEMNRDEPSKTLPVQ